MSGPVIPSRDAWSELVKMYQWWRSYKTQGAQNGQLGQAERRISRHPLRIVIVSAEIQPNTYGYFRFTTGAKGYESATGEEYQGYYRNTSVDAVAIPSGAKCFAIWIPCDTLGDEQTGWELTPEACPV